MVMRFDPFREMDRMTQQLAGTARSQAASVPMDAYRRGDQVFVHFDLPGVDPGSIDVRAERNTLTVRGERYFEEHEGDEPLVQERVQGAFSRQLFLGEHLDVDHIQASYEAGVLTFTIPVAETAKPRRIEVRSSGDEKTSQTIELQAERESDSRAESS